MHEEVGRGFRAAALTGAPCPARGLQVVEVSGAADSGKAAKAAQLRFEGRGLAQALEAVERELA